ncbi:MAG: hypothetical protein QW292_03805 [Candidatus Parvarchaeota archaeon]
MITTVLLLSISLVLSLSVIRKLLHPLVGIDSIVKRTRLGEFWSSLWRKYGHAVLEQNQVEWIVRSKSDGKRKNRDIAWAAVDGYLNSSERGAYGIGLHIRYSASSRWVYLGNLVNSPHHDV